jgi:hypothetical protein
MRNGRKLEQHVAVFGESGSGKTVMVSSFYGAAQEPQNIEANRFHVIAENPSQGTQLSQNYLGMKNSAKAPSATRFAATSYPFIVRLREDAGSKRAKGKPFDALRLVWHDYPGEWFEQDVSGPEEAQRRVEAFRALLSSDVALLLVDAQRLLENEGEEERYLKSLFTNVRNQLLLLRDDLLPDGKPLVTFPRIWMLALSKADLVPDMDVFAFRDLVLEKAGADIVALRDVIASLVDSDEALSVGEDFVVLSSAKFEAGRIEVARRVGVDLVLPLAAVLPLQRHVRWAQAAQVSRKVAAELMSGAELVAAALGVVGGIATALLSRQNKLFGVLGAILGRLGPGVNDAAKLGGTKLAEAHARAVRKHDNLAAALLGFEMELARGERERVLVRSLR